MDSGQTTTVLTLYICSTKTLFEIKSGLGMANIYYLRMDRCPQLLSSTTTTRDDIETTTVFPSPALNCAHNSTTTLFEYTGDQYIEMQSNGAIAELLQAN